MNAMDAMASTAEPQRRIKVSTRATEADAVEVRIRDRGPGIERNRRTNCSSRSTRPKLTASDWG